MFDNPFMIIALILVALFGIVVLFYVADRYSKNNIAKKTDTVKSDVVKANTSSPKPMTMKDSDTQESANTSNIASTLATEIEALIVDDTASRGDKVESASQRSRMHNRRARMVEYYDKKYKSRTVIFDPNSFDEPISPSSSGGFVIDGIEITKEDVKKLTALNDLLARKNFDD